MKELSVYYCPGCGRYCYCQRPKNIICPVCSTPMALLTCYSDFCRLTQAERDKLLIQKIISDDSSLPGRFLAYMRSCTDTRIAVLKDSSRHLADPKAFSSEESHIHQLEAENQKLCDTIQWMHQTIWDLLRKNKDLEHKLEQFLSSNHSR